MPNIKVFSFTFLALALSFFLTGSAVAREDYNRPASGDVVSALVGKENAVTTAGGMLNLFGENGKMVSGYPLSVEGEVFSSSPLLSDITGSSLKEIVMISRNGAGKYFLKAFDGGKNLLASIELGEAVYYDPVEMRVANLSKKDILVVGLSGKIYAYRFNNNSFSSEMILDVGKAAGVAVHSSGQELIVNFSQENSLVVYSKQSGNWSLAKTISLSNPVLYPVVYGLGNKIFGVNSTEIVGFDKSTGDIISGFPARLNGFPIDTPVEGDVNSAIAGLELLVSLSNGNTVIFDSAGNVLSSKFAKKSFLEKSSFIPDQGRMGIFSGIGNYGSIVNLTSFQSLISTLGTIQRPALGSSLPAKISISVDGHVLASSSTYDLGTAFASVGKTYDFTIFNSGLGELNLIGENLVNISGVNADQFFITDYPESSILNGGSSNFSVRFLPTSAGIKNAVLEIVSNDASSTVYIINLIGQAYATPTIYEDAENGNTAGWSLYYPQYQNSTINNEVDPEQGRVIKINQTIAGSQYYRLYKDDGTAWNNSTGKILQWDMKTSNETILYVYITTNKGNKRVIYSFNRAPAYNGADADINIKPSFKDGKWHTVTQNLEQDLKKYDDTLAVTKVNYILVGSLGVGKTAWFDNILLAPDAGFLHIISGTVVGSDGQSLSNIKVRLMSDDTYAITSTTGKFSFTSLPNGNYNLLSLTEHYTFADTSTIVIDNANVENINVLAQFIPTVNYEDAEDGTTQGWSLLYPQYANATITNVVDQDYSRGKVVSLTRTMATGTQAFKLLKNDSTEWSNTYGKILRWDIKTTDAITVYAYLTTNKGVKRALYTFSNTPSYNGADAYFNLGSAFKDGEWHAFSRNLDADMKTFDQDLIVAKVNYFVVSSPAIGKEVRIDNVSLTAEDNSLHTISGTVVDDLGQPISGVKIALTPNDVFMITTTTGKFAFSSLPSGSYNLFSQTEHYILNASSSAIIISDADVSGLTVNAQFVGSLTYEDAENGNTAGWSLYYPQYSNGTISNIVDEVQGKVIRLARTAAGTQYFRLYKENGQQWNNTFAKILQWDMKTTNETVFYVYVTTNKGTRRLVYSFTRDPNKYTGADAEFNLSPSFKDGQWHTVSRNLEQDLKKYDKDLVVTKLSYILVDTLSAGKQVLLDNIKASTDSRSLHTVSGVLSDEQGQPLVNVRVRLMPDNIYVNSTSSGRFAFTSLPDGNFNLALDTAHYELISTSTVVLSGVDSEVNIAARFNNAVIFEDAEDGTTNGWSLYYPQYPSSTIVNVLDDAMHGRVIQIKQTGAGNQLYRLVNDNGSEWDDIFGKILRWDMKTSAEEKTYVYVATNKGNRRVIYTYTGSPSYNNADAYFNIGPALADNQWHSFSRNLEADLKTVDPDIVVTKVKYILLSAPGVNKEIRVDNYILSIEDNSLHTISGTVTNSLGQPQANIRVRLPSSNIFTLTTTTGKFVLSSVPNGNYEITAQIGLDSVSIFATVSGMDIEDLAIVARPNGTVMYEDAENGNISGWSLMYPQYPNAVIANVADDTNHGKVISLSRTTTFNAQSFKLLKDDGTQWNNNIGKILKWDIKTADDAMIFVYITTSKGDKRLIYSFAGTPKYIGSDAYLNLGVGFNDNQWHSFVRNLESDLKTFDSSLTISKVNYITVEMPETARETRIDNILLLAENNSLHSISGTIKNSSGQPFPNMKVRLSPNNVFTTTNVAGNFVFSSLPDGNYSISSLTDHIVLAPDSATVVVNGSDVPNTNLTAQLANVINYEDAEDGTTLGWSLWFTEYLNGTITNVQDDDITHGKVIQILQTINGVQNFRFANADGSDWANGYAKILQWDMKTGSNVDVSVNIATNKGNRHATYTYTKASSYNGVDAYFNIGSALLDRQWHTFSRNLEADMKTVDPEMTISKVNSIVLSSPGWRKSARIDNILMSANTPPAP